jgi:hypothetical protein
MFFAPTCGTHSLVPEQIGVFPVVFDQLATFNDPFGIGRRKVDLIR